MKNTYLPAISGTIVLLLSALAISFVVSCHAPILVHEITGGKGGTSTLKVSLWHNGDSLNNCTAYIKYASGTPPANGLYDDSVHCAYSDSLHPVFFTNLKQGDYYVFATGYTKTLQHLQGGYRTQITTNDTALMKVLVSPQ